MDTSKKIGRPASCACDACPKCKHRIYSKTWYEKNKERVRHYNNTDSQKYNSRKYNLRKYGLTPDSYAKLIEEQDNRCAICQQPETVLGTGGEIKNLAIDHNHETGQTRGLLCNNCNRALGLFQDSAELLERAIKYVR